MAKIVQLHQHKDPKSMTMSELRKYAGDKIPGTGRHRRYKDADRRIQKLTNGDISLLHPWYNGDHIPHWLIDRDGHIFYLSYGSLASELEDGNEESCPYCANTPLDLGRFGSEQLLINYTMNLTFGGAIFAPGQELRGIDDKYRFLCLRHDSAPYETTYRRFHLDSHFEAECPLCAASSPPLPR